MKSILPKIIVIAGPTASGKTALSLEIARKFNGEIVSADSRQIYRGMDIGTAKPAKAEMDGIKHHLIDIKNPDENYTVAEYKKDAIQAINKILKNGKLPILVGGTGLYIKAVIDNLTIPEIKPDPRFRQKLEKELEIKGLLYLYEKLIKLDPEAAYIIDRHNPRRVIRALEIIRGSGKLYSSQRKKGKKIFDALEIGVNMPKDKLREKIEKRVDIMVKKGLIQEVKNLLKKYPPETAAFDAIGYREIIDYLKDADKCRLKLINADISINQQESLPAGRQAHKSASLKEAVEQIKNNTWQYAKRQMTWFNKDNRIQWAETNGKALRLLHKFIIPRQYWAQR
ncbi:MAG: tRNA (adenosine(37)-N6)-dimethylallyltransferase MiaA [Candidatus Wolfebacteria bacterium]|nr:tRNA (adenosine(37)-N6)-dimethylallyltransferase MiaA [Candidatus Wolfebacteria bacterium]